MSKTYVLLTGPLWSGKSTYKTQLCEGLKTLSITEFQAGVDGAAHGWWKPLMRYADAHKTLVVEAHVGYGGYDHIDLGARLGQIVEPPHNLKVVVILPSVKELTRRQRLVDPLATSVGAREELKWYTNVAQQLRAQIITY